MENVFNIIMLIVSILMIGIVLIQSSKTDGASGALMGGGINVFSNVKERGPEIIISRITIALGIVFFVVAILIQM